MADVSGNRIENSSPPMRARVSVYLKLDFDLFQKPAYLIGKMSVSFFPMIFSAVSQNNSATRLFAYKKLRSQSLT